MFKSCPSRGLTSCGRQMSSHDQSARLARLISVRVALRYDF